MSWLAGQKVAIARADRHGVDRESAAVVEFQDDEFEQVGGSVGTQEKRSAWLVVVLEA